MKFTNKFKNESNEPDHEGNDQFFDRQDRQEREINLPQVGPQREDEPLQPQNVEAGPLTWA